MKLKIIDLFEKPRYFPENQRELALWYLYHLKEFTMLTLIKDSMFYKFPARLSELESEFGMLANRKKVISVNKFGNRMKYFEYSAVDKKKIKSIMDKLTRE